ncbi:hypothetical protein HYT59_00075 [Candidatus Woesebacteria bacterium]|nr:hypothetical protein [Candidatus Woesebacteria bacterium]
MLIEKIEDNVESEPDTTRWYTGKFTLKQDSTCVVLRGFKLDTESKEILEEADLEIEPIDLKGEWASCHKWALTMLGKSAEAHFYTHNNRGEISFVYFENNKPVIKTFEGVVIIV